MFNDHVFIYTVETSKHFSIYSDDFSWSLPWRHKEISGYDSVVAAAGTWSRDNWYVSTDIVKFLPVTQCVYCEVGNKVLNIFPFLNPVER